MNKKSPVFVVVLSTILGAILFHNRPLGLNLLIFELAIFALFWLFKFFRFHNTNSAISGIGMIFTAIFTVVVHSTLSYLVNFLAFFLFIGMTIYPGTKLLFNALNLACYNLFSSQYLFAVRLYNLKVKGFNLRRFFLYGQIFIIPIVIIALFVTIYRNSNPVFNDISVVIVNKIQDLLVTLFKNIDFSVLSTLLICLVISNFIWIRDKFSRVIENDILSKSSMSRIRHRKKWFHSMLAIKNENKAAVFLFLVLNGVLLVVNIIDINWVWLNFRWNGNYLKQFVHEGTYLLILSILISIGLVLYYFRGNLNFYAKNKLLVYLSYLWIFQNSILTISVAIRNFYYINYFALAYKRIGVIVFLILVIYGLYSVFVKVRKRKSNSYLYQTNFKALFIVLVVCASVNWDVFIAKYNIKHANSAFLHLDFMASLSDKALPYIEIPIERLNEIDEFQKSKFPFEEEYLSPIAYCKKIESKKQKFIFKWEQFSFLSWNLPEYQAYKIIKGNK